MNSIKLIFTLSLCISFYSILAQKDGYWDKERATKKEIIVAARERIIIKTDDLPIGTTEVVFRITLLDANQQMANSLVSVLKSIPDPTGISQGSAGAVFLLSKISGDDKCKYAIFSNESWAKDYKKNGTITKACYEQNVPVSKDVKRLSIDRSLCILPNSNEMWFGFESKNWIMNQKIVLEVVPWINTKLSSGWTLENKKITIAQCKSTDLAKKIIPAEDFCVCILEKLQKQYKFQEFQQLLDIERSKYYTDFGNACLNETTTTDKTFSDLRQQAEQLVKKEQYGQAIEKLNTIILYGKANATDYNAVGFAYLMTKQYSKAIKFLEKGQNIDNSELLIQLNLAHAHLLSDNFKSAKTIYKKHLSQNLNDSLSWKQKIQQDVEAFQKAGFKSKDFDRVLKLLKD